MKMIRKLTLAAALFLATASLQAQMSTVQFNTWVQTTTAEDGLTNLLSARQVMEILSMSVDASTSIDVTTNGKTVSFGEREDLLPPVPFVVAGPATVTFRRSASGGVGGMITYRVSEKPRPAVARLD